MASCSEQIDKAFAALLHEVPLLQDLLSADTVRGALCLTCSAMREIINGRPSSLTIPPRGSGNGGLNVQCLVKGPLAKQWVDLESLDLLSADLGS